MYGEAKKASEFVRQKINYLKVNNNDSLTKATLAKLRRGIGKIPGSQPELWDVTLNGLPVSLSSISEEPSIGEWSVHTALCLYALHQQGKDIKNQCMHKTDKTLGLAVKQLIDKDKNNEVSVMRRFHIVASSDTRERFIWQLRSLVQLMKNKDIPLDYARLARDIYLFQIPDFRDGVRLQWGQDLYRMQIEGEFK